MAKLPLQPMVVRNCTGMNSAWFEVHADGNTERSTSANLFAALASWCDQYPDQYVGAVNVHYSGDGEPYRLSVLIGQSDTPIPTTSYVVGPKKKKAKAPENPYV